MRASRSIRARLLTGMLLALLVILTAAAWSSYEVAKHESEELFGARLATSARVLEALVARQVARATIADPIEIALPRELELASADAPTPLGHPYETKIAFQVWRGDGTLLARSASAPFRPFAPFVAGFVRQDLDGELWQVFVLRSGETWIEVAEKNEVRDELMHDLGVAVMTPLIVGAALLLVVANLLVLYGLAPLRELAANIDRRDPDTLEPLETSRVPREAAPVVRALNALLTRVRHAFERERRFIDAAAHELRTPLAALKIHADNLARAASETERTRSMQRLAQGVDRAVQLAEQMLAYSRTQERAGVRERAPVHLLDLLIEAVAAVEPLRRARSQQLRLEHDPGLEDLAIEGEPLKVERLAANLLDNASRYAPENSTIVARLTREADSLCLVVENAGEPIPAELRERVLEPYYRLPGSVSAGSGLGLAIVKEIADQHGARLQVGPCADGRGTRVSVHFPLPPA